MAIIRSQYRAIPFFLFALFLSFSHSLFLTLSLCLLPKINISKKHYWRCITIHNRWALRCQSVTRHNTCSKSNCRELRIRTSGIRITFRIEISSWQVCITLCFNFRAASGSRLVAELSSHNILISSLANGPVQLKICSGQLLFIPFPFPFPIPFPVLVGIPGVLG